MTAQSESSPLPDNRRLKNVTVIRAPGYKQKPYEQVVQYPDDCTLHYDTNQSCLLIKRANGEPLAAFRCSAFVVQDEIEVEEPYVFDPPGTEPS